MADTILTRARVQLTTHEFARALMEVPASSMTVEVNAQVIDVGTMEHPHVQRHGARCDLYVDSIELPMTFAKALNMFSAASEIKGLT